MATMATQRNTVAPPVVPVKHGRENIGKSRLAMEVYNWENHRTSHGALVWEIIELNEVYFMVFSASQLDYQRVCQTKHCHCKWRPERTLAIHCIHLLTREKKKSVHPSHWVLNPLFLDKPT